MAAIVEAQESAALPGAVLLEVERLGAGHVGAEAGEEHDRGRSCPACEWNASAGMELG